MALLLPPGALTPLTIRIDPDRSVRQKLRSDLKYLKLRLLFVKSAELD
jgi:hypothetical protein